MSNCLLRGLYCPRYKQPKRGTSNLGTHYMAWRFDTANVAHRFKCKTTIAQFLWNKATPVVRTNRHVSSPMRVILHLRREVLQHVYVCIYIRIAYTSHTFFFFSSHLWSSPSLALSLVVTQIRGHIAGSSPPSPVRFVPCIFIVRIV